MILLKRHILLKSIVIIFYIYFLATNDSHNMRKWFTYLSPAFVYYIIYQIRGILECISLQHLFCVIVLQYGSLMIMSQY